MLTLLKDGSRGAGELAAHFGKLKDAWLVKTRREGTRIIYLLNKSVLEEALAELLGLKDQENDRNRAYPSTGSAYASGPLHSDPCRG